MSKQNIKKIKREINQQNPHRKHRRISVPNRRYNKHIQRPFSKEFQNGDFRNDMYFSINPLFIAWMYIKTITFYAVPALFLHGIMLLIHITAVAAIGEDYSNPSFTAGATRTLIIAYAICLFFGLRKMSDYMAYYNIHMLMHVYNINQQFNTMRYQTVDIESDKELNVMEHYRKKYNKYSLFPSKKELALEEQQYQKESKSRKIPLNQRAALRRERLSMSNKRNEHLAAKEIADWKQAQYGGGNEYDAMVAKYKHRTVPAIHDMIDHVKDQPNFNV